VETSGLKLGVACDAFLTMGVHYGLQRVSVGVLFLCVFLTWQAGAYSAEDNLENDRLDRMTNWLHDNGARFDDISILSNVSRAEGRGVSAIHPILSRQTVAFLPRKVLMTPNAGIKRSKLASAAWYATGYSWSHRLYLQEHVALALFMMEEKKRGPDSFYYPYLSTIPLDLSHLPLFWGEQKLEKFGSSEFPEDILASQRRLDDEFDELKILFRTNSDYGYFATTYTRSDYRWARAQINARAFRVYPEGYVSESTDTVCSNEMLVLAPIADMLNHRPVPNVAWTFSPFLQGFTMTATHSISIGEAVYDSYGKKSNYQYMKNFGFAIKDAPATVELSFYRPDLVDTCMQSAGPLGSSPTPLSFGKGKCWLLPAWQEFLMDIDERGSFPRHQSFLLERSIGEDSENMLKFLKDTRPPKDKQYTAGLKAMNLLMAKCIARLQALEQFAPTQSHGASRERYVRGMADMLDSHIALDTSRFLSSNHPIEEDLSSTRNNSRATNANSTDVAMDGRLDEPSFPGETSEDAFARVIRNGERRVLVWFYHMASAGVKSALESMRQDAEKATNETSSPHVAASFVVSGAGDNGGTCGSGDLDSGLGFEQTLLPPESETTTMGVDEIQQLLQRFLGHSEQSPLPFTSDTNLDDMRELLAQLIESGDQARTSQNHETSPTQDFTDESVPSNDETTAGASPSVVHVAVQAIGSPQIRLALPFPSPGSTAISVEEFSNSESIQQALAILQHAIRDLGEDPLTQGKDIDQYNSLTDKRLKSGITLGVSCLAKYNEDDKYYYARVTGIMEDGTWQVSYLGVAEWQRTAFGWMGPHAPNEIVLGVPTEDLIPVTRTTKINNASAWVPVDHDFDAFPDVSLRLGQSVFSRWQGKRGNLYYDGKVAMIEEDSNGKTFYTIHFNDGDIERHVEPRFLFRRLAYEGLT
jgi:hypothetical protein